MAAGLHHALLGIACTSLFGAGHRLAARMSDDLLARAVAAVVLATAAAVASALGFGLVGLGSDPILLTAVAVATYAATRVLVSSAMPRSGDLLRERLSGLSRGQTLAAGALVAVCGLLLGWRLRYPLIGFDGAVYHLPEIVGWIHAGRPGSIEPVSYLFPFANYPVTDEVALSWAMGISRSLVPLVLWSQLLYFVTGGAGILGLRALGVSRLASVLAVAAVLTVPICVEGLGTPSSDIAALCWLSCAAALAARSSRDPRLLPAALVAAGLALGAKLTVLPLLIAVLGLAAWRFRQSLRPQAAGLAAATLGAVGVGGIWYLRNAVTHGSPLWPFQSLGGDPLPHVWSLIKPSLLDRAHATIAPRVSAYRDVLAGGLLLIAAAPFAWFARRRRAVLFASIAAVLALLAWAAAPSTGQPDTPIFDVNVVSTTRYALPALAAAAVALALATAGTGRGPTLARCLLGGALGWNLLEDLQIGHLSLPYLWAFALAAAVGAATAAVAARPRVARVGRHYALAAAACSVIAAFALLALPARGLLKRHAQVARGVPGGAVSRWALSQPGFERESPIYFVGSLYGQMGGERLQHDLVLIPPGEPCARVRRRAASGLLVVEHTNVFARLGVATPAHCVLGLPPVYDGPGVRVYGTMLRRSAVGAAAP